MQYQFQAAMTEQDYFVEITPQQRSETKYSLVERVSVVENLAIYLHINNLAASVLPMTCFPTRERKEKLVDFLKTKCENVDVYEK